MLVPILIAIAVLLLAFIVFVATRPAEFRIVRSTTVAAPPATVYGLVNDFHKWALWSPWDKIDPNLKRTYSGPAAGIGAMYAWVGNSKVGEGRMTILESHPSDLIKIKLEFLKPFKATNTAQFDFKQSGPQTSVTWSMIGHKNFMSKAFCLFMDMDKMVGGDFEKGLAAMKSVAESPA